MGRIAHGTRWIMHECGAMSENADSGLGRKREKWKTAGKRQGMSYVAWNYQPLFLTFSYMAFLVPSRELAIGQSIAFAHCCSSRLLSLAHCVVRWVSYRGKVRFCVPMSKLHLLKIIPTIRRRCFCHCHCHCQLSPSSIVDDYARSALAPLPSGNFFRGVGQGTLHITNCLRQSALEDATQARQETATRCD